MRIIVDNIKYELRQEENEAYVVENNYKGEVRIPAEIQVGGVTIPVIGIGLDAFYGCDDVTSITLPEGLRIIENNAFESMNGLTEIVIPESVTHIGEWSFSDCENLKKVVLPSQLKYLPADMLESCGELEEVEIPKGVKIIGDGCFGACVKLKNILLPEGLEKIESRAFQFCETLKNIHIPSSVKEIGESAFYSCTSLKSISLPEGLECVPVDCFALCESLEDVIIPSSVKMVEEGGFELTPYKRNGIHYAHDLLVGVGRVDTTDGILAIKEGTRVVCDTAVSDYDNALRKVVCPASLRQIGRKAFRNSKNLEEVVLNEGLECIDGGAFQGCINLKRIYIPSTVRRIEANPFVSCEQLETIVVSPDNPYFDCRGNSNAIIETATNRLITACKTSFIPEDVEEIGVVAFADIKSLEYITIPNSLKRIEWNAFNGCKNLRKITWHDAIEYIGEGAFDGTEWLTNQPNGMIIIGKVLYAYKPTNEHGVEPECVIPEGIQTITHYAFGSGNYSMRIYLPKSMSHISRQTLSFLYENNFEVVTSQKEE